MNNYSLLINNISSLLEQGRKQAVQAVNNILVQTYWQIGKQIVEYEQKGNIRAKYGSNLLTLLSNDLTLRFGRGFDERNLRYMRYFYLNFPIWNAVRSRLSWTHYRLLLSLENKAARRHFLIIRDLVNLSLIIV